MVTRSSENLTEWPSNWFTGLNIGVNRARPRPGPFPSPPGAGLGREAAPNRGFPVPPQKPKNLVDCIWRKAKTKGAEFTVRSVNTSLHPNKATILILAALGSKIKITKIHYPPDPGQDRPKTSDLLNTTTVRTPAGTPRGEGEAKTKSIIV